MKLLEIKKKVHQGMKTNKIKWLEFKENIRWKVAPPCLWGVPLLDSNSLKLQKEKGGELEGLT
ncbi:MAG: hypothetical protein QME78_10375 [Thermodesulfobacteriota bacterium]|nr:hypothetical protein [Thermodesulfobacteriota bacterium]